MIIGNHQLRIRPLIKEDAPFLAKWLSDPAVLEFYEGRDNPFDLNKVLETFYKQEDATNRCLIEWEDQAIGYIQYYVIDDEERIEYELQEVEGTIFGLDQFIGEERYRDKGIGTLLIQTMVEYLKKKNTCIPSLWIHRYKITVPWPVMKSVGSLNKSFCHQRNGMKENTVIAGSFNTRYDQEEQN